MTTPNAPTNLVVIPVNSDVAPPWDANGWLQAACVWDNPATPTLDLAEIHVEIDGSGAWVLGWQGATAAGAHAVQGTPVGLWLDLGHRYRLKVRVRSSDTYDWSNFSSIVDLWGRAGPPTTVVANRDTTTQNRVTINHTLPSNPNHWDVEVSVNGGAWSVLTTALAGTATEYVHTPVSDSSTYKYRVRARCDTPDYQTWYGEDNVSAYTESLTMAVVAAPSAPTGLDIPAFLDAHAASILAWVYNNADGSLQSAYSVRYREQGTVPWTTVAKTASGDLHYDFVADTFANGKTYEVEVQTWGLLVTASAWSATKTFTTTHQPTTAITFPVDDDDVYGTPILSPTWSYYDEDGTTQAAYQLTLYEADGTTVIESQLVYSDANTAELATILESGVSYKVGIKVRDGAGMWSAEDVRAFDAVYLAPMTPTGVVTFDAATGAATVVITNPAPSGGAPACVYNQLYRTIGGVRVLVADQLAQNATVIDYIPSIGVENTYQIVAWSATPSQATSADLDLTPLDGGEYLWLNAGPNFSAFVRAHGSASTDLKASRDQVLHQFAGRTEPVAFDGPSHAESYAISGAIDNGEELATEAALKAVVAFGAPVCFRDHRGHRMFGGLGDSATVKWTTAPYASLAATITQIGGEW